jgi:hypothetical protein
MHQQHKEYQKLSGTKKGFLIGKYTLWQGQDHILHVYSRLGVEDYKRFYFSDIQAIVTRKTAVGLVQNVVMLFFIVLFLMMFISFSGGFSVFYSIVTGLMLILLVINLLRGPTCQTKIMTAVQTEKLYSLHRLKNTFKVMNRLGPLIEHVQGTLTPTDPDQMPVQQPAQKSPSKLAQRSRPLNPTVNQETGKVHMVLFGLLLADGFLVSLRFFSSQVSLTILSSVASILLGIVVLVALVKQHNIDMIRSVRTLTWATLVYVGISFAVGYSLSMMYALKHPGILYNQWEIFNSISNLSPRENPFILGFDLFMICAALLLGIPGLYLLKKSNFYKK